MSQLDRALIRVYTSETLSRTPDVTAQKLEEAMSKPKSSPSSPVASLRAVPRKPTLSELQHWKNQGIRIDMPGSPLVGSYDETLPPASSAADAAVQPDEFTLAAQNTAAVAEALDRLLARAGGQRKPAPVPEKKLPEAKRSAADRADLPSPTIEFEPLAAERNDRKRSAAGPAAKDSSLEFVPAKPQAEPPAAPAGVQVPTTGATLPEQTATDAPSRLYRQRRITQPKWEVEEISWPEEIDMILDQCHDEWQTLAAGISSKSKSMALVSLGEGCGCTTLALCLAKLMVQQNRKVLLIDEGHGPDSLTVRVGLEEGFPPPTQRPIESLYETTIQVANLPIAILPAGYRRQSDLSPAQLQQFSNDFDVILWDGGDRPEAWHRLSLVHQVLVVRDARGTHDHELGQILPKLTARKINVVGVADNFWR